MASGTLEVPVSAWRPTTLHHIGQRVLSLDTVTTNTEGIPGIYDDEDDEEGHIDVDEQDVLLCTDWEGEFKNFSLGEGEELMFIEPNQFYHPEYFWAGTRSDRERGAALHEVIS